MVLLRLKETEQSEQSASTPGETRWAPSSSYSSEDLTQFQADSAEGGPGGTSNKGGAFLGRAPFVADTLDGATPSTFRRPLLLPPAQSSSGP